MKHLFYSGLMLLFTIANALTVGAQEKSVQLNEPDYNKPKLFNTLPATLKVTNGELETLIAPAKSAARGKATEDITKMRAKVAGLSSQYIAANSRIENEYNSVVMVLNDYPGATLTLTSVAKEDGTLVYTGRIISFKHGDAFVLELVNGQYQWTKKGFYDLIAE